MQLFNKNTYSQFDFTQKHVIIYSKHANHIYKEYTMPQAIIIGSGFAGAVSARQLAEHGFKVTLLEKRSHIGGNMYEEFDGNGIRIHKYGPHIFHTNNETVFEYLKRFSDFYPYEHRVLGKIDGKLVPIPFNFRSLDMLFSEEKASALKEKLLHAYNGQQKVSILELLASSDPDIKAFGEYVFDRVFVHYTAKQWQQPIEEVDTSVINRVPVILGYDDRYFGDKFQYMPEDGFTKLFEKLLDHPDIAVRTGCSASERLNFDAESHKIFFDGEEFTSPVIYTGPIDELFGNRYGRLPYRSLNLVFEQLEREIFQPASVVNYPNEEDFTRITEFKHLTGQKSGRYTAILKEYPCRYNPDGDVGSIPFYAIINEENNSLYKKYRETAEQFPNLYLCGRLADYKYYNMDAAAAAALELSEKIISKYGK